MRSSHPLRLGLSRRRPVPPPGRPRLDLVSENGDGRRAAGGRGQKGSASSLPQHLLVQCRVGDGAPPLVLIFKLLETTKLIAALTALLLEPTVIHDLVTPSHRIAYGIDGPCPCWTTACPSCRPPNPAFSAFLPPLALLVPNQIGEPISWT